MKYILFGIAFIYGVRCFLALGMLINEQGQGELVIAASIVPFILAFGFYLVIGVLERIEGKNNF